MSRCVKDGTRGVRAIPGRGAEPRDWTDEEFEAETRRRLQPSELSNALEWLKERAPTIYRDAILRALGKL